MNPSGARHANDVQMHSNMIEGRVRRPSMKLPRIKVGRHDANAVRGPRREDGRYYWQARVWVGAETGRETKAIGWLTEEVEAWKQLTSCGPPSRV